MQTTERYFVTGPIPAKYLKYKYTLLYYLDQLDEEQKTQMKKDLAKELDISVRMIENYIYARQNDRRHNLSENRIQLIAKYMGIEPGIIPTSSGQNGRAAGIGAAAGGSKKEKALTLLRG